MIENFPSISQLISSLPFSKNNYEFSSVLGIGGSSVVFKVKSLNYSSTYFAAKVTPKTNELNVQDFNALKTLSHSYIISVFDYFEDENNFYLILEYCENGSLSSLIKSGQITSKDEMTFYMKKLADVIHFCHSKGIAHRDIKPSNVLLDSYGRPKLIDFGICEMLYFNTDNTQNDDNSYYLARKKGNVKTIRKFFGSAPYLAPEIVLKETYDPFASDVWSLGVTFYELVTGSLPWSTQSEKILNDAICQASISFPNSVPNPMQQLIRLMIQVDPASRPTMKSIAGCSLFQVEIPSTLKMFNPRKNIQQSNSVGDKKDISIGESPENKLKRASNCITFAHFDSFVNTNKDGSNLAFKPSNTTPKRRRKSYAISPASMKQPSLTNMTFITGD